MTTSINPVTPPRVNSQPNTTQHTRAAKPPAQPATSPQDKVTLRSAQTTNQDGDHG